MLFDFQNNTVFCIDVATLSKKWSLTKQHMRHSEFHHAININMTNLVSEHFEIPLILLDLWWPIVFGYFCIRNCFRFHNLIRVSNQTHMNLTLHSDFEFLKKPFLWFCLCNMMTNFVVIFMYRFWVWWYCEVWRKTKQTLKLQESWPPLHFSEMMNRDMCCTPKFAL